MDLEFKFHKQYELEEFDSNGGAGYGRASISDTFDKVVPVIIKADDKILDPKNMKNFEF